MTSDEWLLCFNNFIDAQVGVEIGLGVTEDDHRTVRTTASELASAEDICEYSWRDNQTA